MSSGKRTGKKIFKIFPTCKYDLLERACRVGRDIENLPGEDAIRPPDQILIDEETEEVLYHIKRLIALAHARGIKIDESSEEFWEWIKPYKEIFDRTRARKARHLPPAQLHIVK